jgi:hypothetical protein
MPSLGDTANQALAVLNQINTNTQASAQTETLIKGDTADIKAELGVIETTLQSGFTNLGQGLFAILEQAKETNSLLTAEVAQNTTIICWLTNIADVLCRIMRKTNIEIALQTEMNEDLERIGKTLALVHAREALEVHREEALEEKIEKCCPPEQVPPEPCYEPCQSPEIVIYNPKGGSWQPPGSATIA